MTFVRAFIGKTSNKVRHVIEQDVPFTTGGTIRCSDEELEVQDLGFADEHDWKDLEGNPTSPSRHIFLRLERGDETDMPTFHDCPCTMEGIKARLREQGAAGIPVTARAWLANILPPDQVDALGIGTGISIAARLAAEARRNRRDPNGGSRIEVLQRIAQRQSDARSAAALAKRNGTP
jgi:hypothetical protein